MNRQPYSLLNNSRFYILTGSVLMSVILVAYLRLHIASDQLYYIRVQQVFGLVCIAYWYVALIISPIGYLIGKTRTKHLEFSRRAIGVAAAYFALLHVSVALWGQLGGLQEIALLPTLFKWSLGLGAVALVILLIMAITSFDKVVKFMTYRRWKWLHRLVYLGLILVVLHIWMIGTHLEYASVKWVAFAALALLGGLETFRVYKLSKGKLFDFNHSETIIIFATIWATVVIVVASMPAFVESYHSRHDGGHASSGVRHD